MGELLARWVMRTIGNHHIRAVCGVLLTSLLPLSALTADTPGARGAATIVAAERDFVAFLDARDAVAFIESGRTDRMDGRDLAHWQALAKTRRQTVDDALAVIDLDALATADRPAVEAMRRSLSDVGDEAPVGRAPRTCAEAERKDLDYAALREALVACFVEYGNRLQFEDRQIDRGTGLQLLHVLDEPARRRAVFDSFAPLWRALNGRNERDSPYRRLVALAAADAVSKGSQIAAAARALGIETRELERWLIQVLEAWRDANVARSPGDPSIEPWDFRYVNSAANRRLQAAIPTQSLLPVNIRFYRDLGADLERLGVNFDLAPRADKSPLAYSDFLRRGRTTKAGWSRPIARVVATYPDGGLFALNELVHENGHAVHISAIRTRPAFMDWPDTLFTEAFADVTSWSVHEVSWQRRYLGATAPDCESQRALFGNVMLDVAWSLFEMRLLRDPTADPNLVWTDITSEYFGIAPHPELPWWALRVQLVDSPGYMVNYGLGAILTADIRAATVAAIGPFDAGNARWYRWTSERLLRFGSERDTRSLMTGLLGRPVSPDALLHQLHRCRS